MTNTDTTIRHFIAVSADPTNQLAIYGIGRTADEAIADAVRDGGLQSNLREDNDGFGIARDNVGNILEEVFVAQRCTSALYKIVEARGGADLRWTLNDAGLQDIVID